jgi:hypothetical protein
MQDFQDRIAGYLLEIEDEIAASGLKGTYYLALQARHEADESRSFFLSNDQYARPFRWCDMESPPGQEHHGAYLLVHVAFTDGAKPSYYTIARYTPDGWQFTFGQPAGTAVLYYAAIPEPMA